MALRFKTASVQLFCKAPARAVAPESWMPHACTSRNVSVLLAVSASANAVIPWSPSALVLKSSVCCAGLSERSCSQMSAHHGLECKGRQAQVFTLSTWFVRSATASEEAPAAPTSLQLTSSPSKFLHVPDERMVASSAAPASPRPLKARRAVVRSPRAARSRSSGIE